MIVCVVFLSTTIWFIRKKLRKKVLISFGIFTLSVIAYLFVQNIEIIRSKY
jgi:hypothetical protein